jgi:putative oxidoreductase
MNNTLILRIAVSIVLLAHSIQSIVSGDVNDFGRLYLDQVGFAPFGLVIAWAVKLSHLAGAVLLLMDKYVKWVGWITIAILVAGIIMIHAKEGWFVVGYGRNGMEFNVLLIFVLLSIMYQNRLAKV